MATLKKISKKPTEREMWNRIKGALHHNGRRAYRIEALATPGFPDVVWVMEQGVQLIELKAGPMKFRPLQVKFIKDAHALGQTIWVLNQMEKRGEMRVYHGVDAVDWPALACDAPEGVLIEKWLEDATNG